MKAAHGGSVAYSYKQYSVKFILLIRIVRKKSVYNKICVCVYLNTTKKFKGRHGF